jgi:hypothetical protein
VLVFNNESFSELEPAFERERIAYWFTTRVRPK